MEERKIRLGAVPENSIVEIISTEDNVWFNSDEERNALIGLKVRVEHPCFKRSICYPVDQAQKVLLSTSKYRNIRDCVERFNITPDLTFIKIIS